MGHDADAGDNEASSDEHGSPAPAAGSPPPDPVSRRHLILLVGPIIALVICSNVGNALFATLSTENPLLLIALSAPNRNLILASHQIPLVAYFVVGFVRLMVPDFFFYALGYHYGDRSTVWMERRTPSFGAMMRQLETVFAKAGHVLVLIMPNNPVCLIAGAARMRRSVFWTLNVVGTIGRLIIMWWIGDVFQSTVDSILEFIQRYRVQLLVVSIGLVAFNLLREWRAGNSEIQQLMDLEHQLEDQGVTTADEGSPVQD